MSATIEDDEMDREPTDSELELVKAVERLINEDRFKKSQTLEPDFMSELAKL